jgi:hypothetical protein
MRGRTSTPSSRARSTSGWSRGTAMVVTRTSTSCSTWAASWPTATGMPSARSAAWAAPSTASQPLTAKPSARYQRASPCMLTPPMPMKWTRVVAGLRWSALVHRGSLLGSGFGDAGAPAPGGGRRRASGVRVGEQQIAAAGGAAGAGGVRGAAPRPGVEQRAPGAFQRLRIALRRPQAGAIGREGLRVVPLVVLGCAREGHHHERHAVEGGVRQGTEAAAGDRQVGGGERRRRVDEAGEQRAGSRSPGGADRVEPALAGLVQQPQLGWSACSRSAMAGTVSLRYAEPWEPPSTSVRVASAGTPRAARACARSTRRSRTGSGTSAVRARGSLGAGDRLREHHQAGVARERPRHQARHGVGLVQHVGGSGEPGAATPGRLAKPPKPTSRSGRDRRSSRAACAIPASARASAAGEGARGRACRPRRRRTRRRRRGSRRPRGRRRRPARRPTSRRRGPSRRAPGRGRRGRRCRRWRARGVVRGARARHAARRWASVTAAPPLGTAAPPLGSVTAALLARAPRGRRRGRSRGRSPPTASS